MALGKIIREFGVKLSLAYDKAGYESANKAINDMAGTLKEIGFGAAAAAGTIFGFAEATAGNAKDLELYSQTLGISAERLQELSYGAKIAANVNRDELMGALEGVSKTLDDVKRGNLEAGSTFQALGINVGAMVKSGMRADQVMALVGDRLKTIQDPIARSALAAKVFGGNVGTKLLPYLLKGSAGMADLGKEARNLGVIMDDKTLKSQAKFQDSLNRVLFVLKNISYLIGGELIKRLEPLVKQFQKWIVHNRKLIASGIVEFVKALGWGLKNILELAIGAADAFKSLSTYVGGTGNGIKILIGVWAGFKAIQMAVAIGELAAAFASMGVSLETMAPELLLLSGLFVAIHDGYELLKTGDFKQTWVYEMVEYLKGFSSDSLVGKLVGKMSDIKGSEWENIGKPGAAPGNAYARSPMYGGTGGGMQGAPLNVTNNFSMAPGTTVEQGAEMVSRAMQKTQQYHQELRNTRNAAAGGIEQ